VVFVGRDEPSTCKVAVVVDASSRAAVFDVDEVIAREVVVVGVGNGNILADVIKGIVVVDAGHVVDSDANEVTAVFDVDGTVDVEVAGEIVVVEVVEKTAAINVIKKLVVFGVGNIGGVVDAGDRTTGTTVDSDGDEKRKILLDDGRLVVGIGDA